jgi:hypothetical protein
MAGITQPWPAEEPLTEEIRRLLDRAQQGDAVLPQLRELLDNRPELWRRLGDLVSHVEEALLDLAAGKSLLAKESIRRRMDELRAELSVPPPTPVEKLLIDRVVVTWAQCHLADLDELQKMRSGKSPGSDAQRRASAAQNRYLAAVKQLTVVRKLIKPAPSTLELLRYPLGEGAGAGKKPHARGGISLATAGVPRG